MNILVTGAAGFIGFHLCKKLLSCGYNVIGIDNINDYYSVQLKKDRLSILLKEKNFKFVYQNLSEKKSLEVIFSQECITHVINLAAQAGVRYSLKNPESYISSNIVGFYNILECCRNYPVNHLLFASSSSVYGLNTAQPYSPHNNANHPVSLYAATKCSNELMAHAYSHLFNIPSTGLRFFTVYGPWGRPDMALHLFTNSIVNNKPINIFNSGNMNRDFTYIDDIVEVIFRLINLPPNSQKNWDTSIADPATSSAPWRIVNVGNDKPIKLSEFIKILEDTIGKKAIKNYLPMQQGDVISTWADISDLEKLILFKPKTSLQDGMKIFWNWYKNYYTI